MKERRQLTIGVHRDKYDSLSEKKAALEEALGRKVDWGTYLLMLASQKTFNESVAVLHDSEGEEEVNPEDYEEIDAWVTREDVEEVVGKAADKIISELKKYLNPNTDKSSGKGNEKP